MPELEMWQDQLPGEGVCRHCAIAPGPVCNAYACVMRDALEDEAEGLDALAQQEETP